MFDYLTLRRAVGLAKAAHRAKEPGSVLSCEDRAIPVVEEKPEIPNPFYLEPEPFEHGLVVIHGVKGVPGGEHKEDIGDVPVKALDGSGSGAARRKGRARPRSRPRIP